MPVPSDILNPRRWKEILGCNRCARGFYGTLVFDEPASASAPRGICHACQDEGATR